MPASRCFVLSSPNASGVSERFKEDSTDRKLNFNVVIFKRKVENSRNYKLQKFLKDKLKTPRVRGIQR